MTATTACAHLKAFLDAYNFAKRLRTLKGLTPFEYTRKLWTEQPYRLQRQSNPSHGTPSTCRRNPRGPEIQPIAVAAY